jgi:hypothetical protein
MREFGLFIENAIINDFLLIFYSKTPMNLHIAVQLPVAVDNSGEGESNWIDPFGFSIITGLKMFYFKFS